jgi:hypothetical protein
MWAPQVASGQDPPRVHGEFGNLPRAYFLVASIYVATFADFDGTIAVDFHEVAVLDHAAHVLPVGLSEIWNRRSEGRAEFGGRCFFVYSSGAGNKIRI